MYNMEAFFMPEYSYFQKICEINSFHCLALRWLKGYFKVA